jgi:mRNA interferase RelE/StbE
MKTPGYKILYHATVVSDDIKALPVAIKLTIKKAIEERLGEDPLKFGQPLRYSFKGYRRLRVGTYRIVYLIDHPLKTVVIVAIKHRKDVYEKSIL